MSSVDLFVPGDSPVHRLDPRTKVIAVAAVVLALIVLDRPSALFLGLGAVHLLFALARVPFVRVRQLWRAILPLLVLVVVLWPLFDRSGEPVLVELGWFRITLPALVRGLAATARLAAISLLVGLWLATTSPALVIQGFVRLGLPHRWGVAVGLALRTIPAIAARFRETLDAQHARGLVISGGPIRRLRAYVPVAIATLVATIRLAEHTAWALEARGFGAEVRPTSRHVLALTPVDRAVLASAVALCVAVIAARVSGLPV